MREYRVKILGRTYLVKASDNHEAKRSAVRDNRSDFPGKSFSYLVSMTQAHLTHPNVSGRKSIMDLDFRGFE